MRVVHRVFITVAAGAALAAPPAHAGWTQPLLISQRADTSVGYPAIAVGSGGDRLALWTQSSTPAIGSSYVVRGSEAKAGGFWSPLAAPVSAPGAQTGNGALALDVAPNGASAAAWVQNAGGDMTIATRPGGFGTVFGAPHSLTRPAGAAACPNNNTLSDNGAIEPAVAMGNTGGHVGWFAPCGGTSNGKFMKFAPFSADGTVADYGTIAGKASDNGSAGTYGGPQLLHDDVTGFGRMVFVAPSPSAGLLEYRLNGDKVDGGVPTVVEASTPTRNQGTSRNAQLANGDLVSAWRNTQVVPAAIEVRVGNTPPVRVNPAGQDGIAPEVAAGRDGTIVAAWLASGAWWAAVRHPVTKAWGPAHKLSEPDARALRLGISDVGVAYAVWHRDTGAYTIIEGSILDPYDPARSPGTPWQFQPVAETIFDADNGGASDGPLGDAEYPQIAVAPDGQAWLVFRSSTGLTPPLYGVAVVHSPISRGAQSDPTPTPTPVAGPAPTPTPAPGPAADRTPPRITVLSSSRQRFAIGAKEGKVVADRGERTVGSKKLKTALRVGTVAKWTQTEAGKATLVLEHVGCWTLTFIGDPPEHAAVCKNKKLDGVLLSKTVTAKLGGNAYTILSTKLNKNKPFRLNGRYRLTVTPTDAAGNRGTARTIVLEIDGPRDK